MEHEKINTIDMTRKIREKFVRRLAGKTHAERTAFYRQRAMKMDKKIPTLLNELKLQGGIYPDDHPAWPRNQKLDPTFNNIREDRSPYKKGK